MKKEKMSLTKSIAITAMLLALCVASQFFKNLSVYITGPVINLCLVLAVMTVGVMWGSVLAVITPVTAFLIASSPVMTALPVIIVFIMLGNEVLVLAVHFLFKPAMLTSKAYPGVKPAVMALLSSFAKGIFMGLTISLWLLPTFIPAESPLMNKLGVFQTTFSVVQFITAFIGFIYFFIVWIPVKKYMKRFD